MQTHRGTGWLDNEVLHRGTGWLDDKVLDVLTKTAEVSIFPPDLAFLVGSALMLRR